MGCRGPFPLPRCRVGLTRRLRRWWTKRRILASVRASPVHFSKIEFVEYPNDADPGAFPRTVFVARQGGNNKWLLFRCPCNKKHDAVLRLQGGKGRVWEFYDKNGHPTIWPSVFFTASQCHYWVVEGKVAWVGRGRGHGSGSEHA